MPITTGSNPKALWPGIKVWWGRKYDEQPKHYEKLFEMRSSDQNYEDLVELTGFPLAPVKPQGQSTTYADESQGVVNRAVHVAYSLGYICTREEKDDNLYEQVSKTRTAQIAFSHATTKNTVAANVYNRAFSGSYTFGDGVSLLNASHPVKGGGVQSNVLSVAADFSEAALEDLCIQIMNAKNANYLNISLQPKRLIGSTSQYFEFKRVVESVLQNDTANNAINVINASGMIPEMHTTPFLSDTDAWFVMTNAPDGLIGFDRTPFEISMDGDFDTENIKAKAYERYSFTIGDWRGLYGSQGA